jgi:hypothetical protein
MAGDASHSGASTSAVDECHAEQVKSILERTYSISCMAVATEVRISPAGVYLILMSSLRMQKVCAKWIPHVPNDDQRAIHVLIATTHLQHWRNEDSAFLLHFNG